MVNKLTYIESEQYNPYKNLAVEEYLFFHCQKEECILYLWQNQHTVVIGRNQNAWAECLTEKLENEGGYLARRLSGGGAVYHDLGNLNFTFLVNKENYNVDRQLEVIQKAVAKFGVCTEKSGRNDILINGRKFSGNAFYKEGSRCYHHGTIMLDVKLDEMSKYLTVSKEKLQSKGVNSVKSRVVNIKELVPDITVDRMKEALREAFEEVYGGQAKCCQWKNQNRLRLIILQNVWVHGTGSLGVKFRLTRHLHIGLTGDRYHWICVCRKVGLQILLCIQMR